MKQKSILLTILATVYILSMMVCFIRGVLELATGDLGRGRQLMIYFGLALPGSAVSLLSLVLPGQNHSEDLELLLLALAPILNVLLVILVVRLLRPQNPQASNPA